MQYAAQLVLAQTTAVCLGDVSPFQAAQLVSASSSVLSLPLPGMWLV